MNSPRCLKDDKVIFFFPRQKKTNTSFDKCRPYCSPYWNSYSSCKISTMPCTSSLYFCKHFLLKKLQVPLAFSSNPCSSRSLPHRGTWTSRQLSISMQSERDSGKKQPSHLTHRGRMQALLRGAAADVCPAEQLQAEGSSVLSQEQLQAPRPARSMPCQAHCTSQAHSFCSCFQRVRYQH